MQITLFHVERFAGMCALTLSDRVTPFAELWPLVRDGIRELELRFNMETLDTWLPKYCKALRNVFERGMQQLKAKSKIHWTSRVITESLNMIMHFVTNDMSMPLFTMVGLLEDAQMWIEKWARGLLAVSNCVSRGVS